MVVGCDVCSSSIHVTQAELSLYDLPAQDPDAGPPVVGDACTKVNSIFVPSQTVYWTCGIAVKGDYACGGGASPFLTSAYQLSPTCRCALGNGTLEQPCAATHGPSHFYLYRTLLHAADNCKCGQGTAIVLEERSRVMLS